MRNIKKMRNFVLGTLLTLCLFSSSTHIFACEQPLQYENDIYEITNTDDISLAAKLLGLTEEEAKDATFYSTNIETIEYGVTEMPSFTLWTYNRGNDRIFNGTKLKTAIVIKGSENTYVHVRFCSYQNVIWYTDLHIGDEGYAVYNPDYWHDIMYGGTYFMTYEALNTGLYGTEVTVIFALI